MVTMPYNDDISILAGLCARLQQISEGVITVKKRKTSLDLMKEIRTVWTMNPVTRVHDNDIRKSKKKMRSEGKKEIKKALGNDPKSFFYLSDKLHFPTCSGTAVSGSPAFTSTLIPSITSP